MKIFQVVSDICHWLTPYRTVEETVGLYPPTDVFVEAPDYVFEGWGYLNGEFVKPEPPPGWCYDENTGTFYPEGEPVTPVMTTEEATLDMLADIDYRLGLLELGGQEVKL